MSKRIRRIHKRVMHTHRRHIRRIKKVARQPFFTIPALTFLVLCTITVGVLLILNHGSPRLHVSDTNIVVFSHDKEEEIVPTRAKTVGDMLQKLDFKLNEGDVVEPAKTTEIIGDNFRVNVYRAMPVTIVDGGKKTFTYSAAATPRSIVKQANVQVYPEDKLELVPTTNFLTQGSIGEQVVIKRATPVYVNLYGTNVPLRTHAKTVGDLLREHNIKLGKDDTVQPSASTAITTNAQVFIVRKGTQITTEEQEIPFPVEEVQDNSLTFGTRAIRQQGTPGKKLVTFQIETQNGQETGRTVIQEVTAVEPVKQIVAVGQHFDIAADKTAVMAAAGLSKSEYVYADYIISRESGWCHTKWQGEYGGCPAYHGTPTSSKTGYGLCQATPGYKMATAGDDWGTNPVTQLKWCSGYAKSRYGSWGAAYNHWLSSHNW